MATHVGQGSIYDYCDNYLAHACSKGGSGLSERASGTDRQKRGPPDSPASRARDSRDAVPAREVLLDGRRLRPTARKRAFSGASLRPPVYLRTVSAIRSATVCAKHDTIPASEIHQRPVASDSAESANRSASLASQAAACWHHRSRRNCRTISCVRAARFEVIGCVDGPTQRGSNHQEITLVDGIGLVD